jgi:AcrR family transcriptional regulator/DNA-binding MarR family transcriptional regulator
MAVVHDTRPVPPAPKRRRSIEAGHPRGQVAEMQHARLLAAVVDGICETGCAELTISDVIGRARVSRKTFYQLFDDREDCIVAAFEQTVAENLMLAREAYDCESGWREGIRSALGSLLASMDERPAFARLCLVDVFSSGEQVMQRRAEVLAEIARFIDRARSLESTREPPQMTAEGVIGAVLAVLHKRVLEQSEEPLAGLLGPLMGIIVLPYLGSRAAGRELNGRRADARRVRSARRPARRIDVLEGLNMRVTYRTMRVLVAVSEQPGTSNREIAHASGVTDQGQISKLMTRLERLHLVENRGPGQERGAANAWYLTPRGTELEQLAGLRLTDRMTPMRATASGS